MKKLPLIPGLLVLAFLILLRASAQEEKPLRLAQTIALPAVEGRIDHLAVDVQSQRLFLAALGNNTLEVIDLKAGKVIHTVKGLREPQGVAFVPEANAVYVANGGDGNCEAFAADSLAPLRGAKFSGDADNLRYDPGAKLLYAGYGDGAIGIFEALTGKIVGDIKLPAHPEAFALEQAGARIFVNIPKAKHVAVIEKSFAIGMGGQLANNVDLALRNTARAPQVHSVVAGLGGRPITRQSLHKVLRRALLQPWEGVHFLDLNEAIVAKELHHVRKVRRSGPTAENILRYLSAGAQQQAAE